MTGGVTDLIHSLDGIAVQSKRYSDTATVWFRWFENKLHSDDIASVLFYYTLTTQLVFLVGLKLCFIFQLGFVVMIMYFLLYISLFAYVFKDHFFSFLNNKQPAAAAKIINDGTKRDKTKQN